MYNKAEIYWCIITWSNIFVWVDLYSLIECQNLLYNIRA